MSRSALLSVVLGLTAAVCWGTADFLAKRDAQRDGGGSTALSLYLVGFPLFTALWIARGATLPRGALPFWLLAGVLNAGGYLALYRGLEVGLLSIVSASNASWSAVTVLGAVALLGERPGRIAAVGIALSIAGVVAVGFEGHGGAADARPPGATTRRRFGAPGLREGLLSAVFFGASFFALKLPAAAGDALAQAVVMRGTGLLLAAGALALRGGLPAVRAAVRPPRLFALLDSLGFLAFVWGLAVGAAYVVAPLGGLLTAVAVALGALFLRERLRAHQWAGFALVVAGALLLASMR